MRDILLISPFIQKPGIQIEEVKEDDVHDRDTRLNEERKEALAAQQEQRRKEEEKDLLEDLLKRELLVLKQLETKGLDVRVNFESGEICEFRREEIQMLKTVI